MKRQVAFFACTIWLVGFASFAHAQSDEDLGNWTLKSATGSRSVQAKPVSLSNGRLTLQDGKGRQLALPLTELPESERKTALIHVVGSAVVMIQGKDVLDELSSVGSGFLFRGDGMILTNYHVVRGAASIEVQFRDADAACKADLLAVDRLNDVAILKAAKVPAGTHVVELSVQGRPRQGDDVWTIGHPNRLKNTISWGDVNAVRKTAELPEELRKYLKAPDGTYWIQTDAVIAQGSSGGPLLNPLGQAIGMNTFLVGPQLGFAVHLIHARQTFQQAQNAQPLALPLAPGEHETSFGWWSREVAPIMVAFGKDAERLGQIRLSSDELVTKGNELRAQYRKELQKVVDAAPESWPAYQASYLLCESLADDSDDSRKCRKQIYELLLKHHLPRRDIGRVAASVVAYSDEDSRAFCRAILEKSAHPQVKAEAGWAMAAINLVSMDTEGTLDLGKIQAARDDVEAMAKRMETEFAKVEIFDSVGKEAAVALRAYLTSVRIGLPAAATKGVDMDGKLFQLSDYKGKVILLDFFANWCPWCKRMYPFERQLVERFKVQPFALLGVSVDNQKILERLVQDGTVTWRSWADGEGGPIAESWGVSSYPNLYLIDHNGVVRKHFRGSPTEKDLEDAIVALLNEAKAKDAKQPDNR
jgi:S1-C subfamily serine protease/peroxiredoxin